MTREERDTLKVGSSQGWDGSVPSQELGCGRARCNSAPINTASAKSINGGTYKMGLDAMGHEALRSSYRVWLREQVQWLDQLKTVMDRDGMVAAWKMIERRQEAIGIEYGLWAQNNEGGNDDRMDQEVAD